MRWMRCELDGRARLGLLEGDVVHLHDGELFAAPQPTGVRVPLRPRTAGPSRPSRCTS
jgi:hypothetical protein